MKMKPPEIIISPSFTLAQAKLLRTILLDCVTVEELAELEKLQNVVERAIRAEVEGWMDFKLNDRVRFKGSIVELDTFKIIRRKEVNGECESLTIRHEHTGEIHADVTHDRLQSANWETENWETDEESASCEKNTV
jgi:hypothetical protein